MNVSVRDGECLDVGRRGGAESGWTRGVTGTRASALRVRGDQQWDCSANAAAGLELAVWSPSSIKRSISGAPHIPNAAALGEARSLRINQYATALGEVRGLRIDQAISGGTAACGGEAMAQAHPCWAARPQTGSRSLDERVTGTRGNASPRSASRVGGAVRGGATMLRHMPYMA